MLNLLKFKVPGLIKEKEKTADLTKAQNDLNASMSKEPKGGLLQQILSRTKSDTSQWGKDLTKFFGFASGTNYAPGGWAVVGEHGPEMMHVPQGSQIKNNAQMGSMHNSSTSTVTIGTVVLSSQSAVQEFFSKIDQDTLLSSRGLTANRGVR